MLITISASKIPHHVCLGIRDAFVSNQRVEKAHGEMIVLNKNCRHDEDQPFLFEFWVLGREREREGTQQGQRLKGTQQA